jgi:hypothetical protein
MLQNRAELPPARPRFREYAELPHPLDAVREASAPGKENIFQGQVVILGGEYDDRDRLDTPLGRQFGDLIVGQLVEAELRGDIIGDLPRWAGIAIELAIGLLVMAVYKRLPERPGRAHFITIVLGGVIAGCTIAAFYLGSFWLEAGVFFVALAIEQHVEAVRNANDLAKATGPSGQCPHVRKRSGHTSPEVGA